LVLNVIQCRFGALAGWLTVAGWPAVTGWLAGCDWLPGWPRLAGWPWLAGWLAGQWNSPKVLKFLWFYSF